MYPAVRRKDRIIPREEALALLNAAEYGTLATASAGGQPYATPLSFIVKGGAIYFHCAQSGHKMENIEANPRVCFSVVGKTRPVYDKGFSYHYESAVAFGRAAPIADEAEKVAVLTQLCEKYLPAYMAHAAAEIQGSLARTAIIKITIEHITGKAKRA
ncbi:MAG: pyridoxamine 5'-phosphate oxidase family protein [Clostridiales bacterium]|jgi:nitroimidazol reductase NimA-like FMN-containing flavoprotein (pyridoxamine 5'-phosphate oxidase superfamily)|nr:pyridoxamine 5'-phosphate oxidase family protein [Clostridiales bacterium]